MPFVDWATKTVCVLFTQNTLCFIEWKKKAQPSCVGVHASPTAPQQHWPIQPTTVSCFTARSSTLRTVLLLSRVDEWIFINTSDWRSNQSIQEIKTIHSIKLSIQMLTDALELQHACTSCMLSLWGSCWFLFHSAGQQCTVNWASPFVVPYCPHTFCIVAKNCSVSGSRFAVFFTVSKKKTATQPQELRYKAVNHFWL